jgi:hypothetical protein
MDCHLAILYAAVLGWLDCTGALAAAVHSTALSATRSESPNRQSTAAIVFTRSAICEPGGAA